MNDFYLELRKQVKLGIQLPDDYTDIDSHLDLLIKSSKMYIDVALDNQITDLNNDLYKFVIIQLAIFKYVNVDNNVNTYPIYITSAINQLKFS
ncbi:hypothetical protein [Apilactobacillus timberlakei]|uniref:hypothetical protein n=1 Tax=Apilactobacillus timberlakei TaxID=2008380 RepID=UPI00112EA39D|nr:hypothetical protein [Apilactobacillus timberlakei]TPR12142.1 hypothetical protein DYZ97_07685 [Apilactobacillus timberlakei]